MNRNILKPGTGLVIVLILIWNMACSDANRAQPSIHNPIVPGYFADPTIIVEDGVFHLYATIDPWGGDSLAYWQSSDFIHWQRLPLDWKLLIARSSTQALIIKIISHNTWFHFFYGNHLANLLQRKN